MGKGPIFSMYEEMEMPGENLKKALMESAKQIHVQLFASCIGERPSVLASSQLTLPQG